MENTPDYILDGALFESDRSIVYRSQRKRDKKSLVLKILKNDFPTQEEIARYKREYEIIRSLDVDGVIRAESLEKYGNNLMMVLEDFGGDSLNHLLSSEVLDLKKFLRLAIRIVEILGDIHQHNIIHKDINPSNILWNPKTDVVKIIDFGISTKLSRENPGLHNVAVLEGTLPYISPEQTGRMNRSIDYRTDYYSLGITFYEILTGFLPFWSDDAMELVHCHIAKKPSPPHEAVAEASFIQKENGHLFPYTMRGIHGKIPEVISEIVTKLIEKSAENRYQSSFGLKSDLQRCLEQLEATREIGVFEIGNNDISDRFQIPQQLYGRETELETLLNIFETVSTGTTEIMLVSGYPGVGKSMLVNEVHKPIVRKRGYFTEGKFDQFTRNVPYSAISHAFGQLIQQLLSEPEESLEIWKERLLEALGPNGQIIINIIPEVEQIIGPQSPLKELNPTEAQSRFLFTFGNFVKVFARPEHPLTIFMDDLQWSDTPNLKLIESLMTMTDIRYLFIIGAYRDNEVTRGHPLMLTVDEIKKHKQMHQLFVQPLSLHTLNLLVADTFHCTPVHSQPLANIIYQKTGGNPFFSKELLQNLYQSEIVYFLPERGIWDWAPEKIQDTDVSDNIVAFLIERLQKLPEKTQRCLQVASCIGNIFDFFTLSIINDLPAEVTADALWDAIEQGIIIPLNNEYRLLHSWKSSPGEAFPVFEVYYQFQHDRLQQAAYSLIKEDKKRDVHLQIGRLMLQHANMEEREEKVIDIVRHLNQGISLIKDSTEREELVRLNLTAGKKAKASSAYLPAFQYLGIAKNLLPENSWEKHDSLTFEVLKRYSESAYLCGEFEEAEKYCKILINRAKTRREKADIREMQLAHYLFFGKMEDSIQVGIKGLRQLGIKLSAEPSMLSIIKEVLFTKWNLRKRTTEELLGQPIITDPEKKLAMKLLVDFIPPAFLTGRANLFATAVLKKVNLSLRYGSCPESAAAYSGYAVLMAGLGDLKAANKFGKLAIKLNERFNDPEWKGLVYTSYSLFVHSWNEPWKTLSEWFKKSIEVGLQTGDLVYTALACVYVTLWDPVIDIDTAIEEGKKYISLIERTPNQDALDSAQVAQQRWLNFKGRTYSRFSFNDASFDEKKCLERMIRVNYMSGIAIYHIYKVHIYYLYEEYNSALKHLKEADKAIKGVVGSPYMEEYCTFGFLTLAALFPSMNAAEKRKAWKRLKKEYKRMKKWSDHCPVNFLHHRLLMEAEMARLSKNYLDAVKYYNQAIKAAEENEFLRYRALTNELAARFYLEQGENKIASIYLKDAHYYYSRWGAEVKVKLLEEKYPSLLITGRRIPHLLERSADEPTPSGTDSKEMLDLSTILKVSRTISREINLSELLKKIMRIVIENAGAQHGVLILKKNDRWAIEVEGDAEKNVMKLTGSTELEESNNISKSVIHYAIRTKQDVVLDDASNDEMFGSDPYIMKNQPKSVLCSPMISQGKISGIWYMENNLTVGAFTEARLKILDMLSSQISISLENARMYQELDDLNKNLEQKVVERTQQLNDKNKQIMDSINYAQNIQFSILPKEELMRRYLSEHFIIWKPRDIVGGDFYWFEVFEENYLIAVGDCTGHGVPGSLMTMTTNSVLSRIVEGTCHDNPARILKELNLIMRATLSQDLKTTLTDDGLDIAVCYIMPKGKKMVFSGAKIPIYWCVEDEVNAIKGDRQSIGYKRSKKDFEYTNHEIGIEKNSTFYLTTDGFIHQNGGEKDFSFGRKRFKDILSKNSRRPLEEQKKILEFELKKYQGNELQRDDITVLGFKI